MSYNYDIYANRIKRWIPHISDKDLPWLCNQCASVYKDIDDGCVDNFRVCSSFGASDMSSEYKTARNSGCCGSRDVRVNNPLTGNAFMIGFNYGH